MAGIIPNIDLPQITGDTSSNTDGASAAETEPKIEEFVTEEGGLLAVAYGEHLVAGHLIVHKYSAGPPPSSIFTVALGDGQGSRWDSLLKVWYAGEELSSSPDSTTPGYHFHPGTISTGIADGTQGVDSFLPNGNAYSGTAIVVVKLPESKAVEDRPDKLRVRAKTLRTADYDINGNEIGVSYLPNPARVAVARIKRYYDLRYFNNSGIAAQKFRDRINWPRWARWRDYCAENISWNDGTSNRNIPRFECHIAFKEEANLADVLDQICASCASFWQDDGEQIIFLTPEDQTPIHAFDESDIVAGSFRIEPKDIRDVTNQITAKFRNLDDPFLTEASLEVKRTDLIEKVGKIPRVRQFPNMLYSQAQRLLERQLRIEAGFKGSGLPVICNLRGFADSFHVLPGDFVSVTHSIPNWSSQLCLVLEASIDSAEKSPDETDFVLQKIDGVLYSDSDHKPVQTELTP